MPEHDTLHDYRPDPTFEIASHLAKGEGISEDATVPQSARKASGMLDGFHAHFCFGHKTTPPKPKSFEETEEKKWADLSYEQQLGEIDKLTRQQLTEDLDEAFKSKTFVAPSKADDDLPEYPATRPYVRKLLAEAKDGWPTIKEEFVSKANSMGAFLSFRSNYVNGMILALKEGGYGDEKDPKKALTFACKSVGSVNLTSDYDLTAGGPDDVAALFEFNRAFRSAWRKESGTLFDTNLYFRDWMIVKDQIPKKKADYEDESIQVAVLEPIGDLYGLVKIRRYTSKVEWNALVAAVRKDVAIPGFKSAAEAPRFKRFDLVDQIFDVQYVQPLLARLKDVHRRFEQSEEGKQLGSGASKSTLKTLRRLHHFAPDDVLRVCNIAYVELGGKLRDDEEELKQQQEYKGDFTWRQNKGADLVDKATPFNLKGFTVFTERHSILLSEAVMFAAEAYNTQGSLWTIVGGQGGEVPKNMELSHYLQTFNEQVGDGLKELREHFFAAEHAESTKEKEAEAHTAYFRASKYEGRMKAMLDAMVKILKADPVVKRRKEIHAELFPGTIGPDEDDLGTLSFEGVLADIYDQHVKKLKKIRGAESPYDKNTPEQNRAEAKKLVDETVQQGSQFSHMIRDGARLIAKPELPSGSKYNPDLRDGTFTWGLSHLMYHLLWHCALVNKLVRKIQSRGPSELWVRNFALS
ncbi:MAG: hypothetical protein AB7N76_32250 [Planctomycetota bacterium]